MTTEAFRIELVTIAHIREFAEKEIAVAGRGGWVPITRQRAAAHAANPHAAPEDAALLVAYSGDKWIGYLGIMPGRLKTSTGLHKMYWVSTFYVDPEYRGQRVGSGLLQRASSLGYDLVGADASEVAERVYRALGFPELGPLVYYCATVRTQNGASLYSLALRLARRALTLVGLNWRGLDAVIEDAKHRKASFHRAATLLRLASEAKVSLGTLSYDLQSEPFSEDSTPRFTPDHSQTQRAHFHRGPEVIEWMLRYKWVVANADEPESMRYIFSNTRHSFAFAYVSLLTSAERSAGNVTLSISRRSEADPGNLKVLDFHLEAEVSSLALVEVLLHVAGRLRVGTIEFPEELKLGPLAGGGLLDLKPIERPYFCMSMKSGGPLASAFGDIVLNFCDGDSSFV